MPEKRGQVLPFTLTELLALLFFALALALAYQWNRRREIEQEIAEHGALLEVSTRLGPSASAGLARLLSSGRERLPDDFRELTRRLASDGEIREVLIAESRAAGLDSIYPDTADVLVLLDSVVVQRNRAEREAEAFAAAAGVPDSGRSVIEQLIGRLDQQETQLAQAHDESTNLLGQVENLRRRVGNGMDHPPCWADIAGGIEYAFEVMIRTNTVTVSPIWPAYREDDARNIPGMLQLIGDDLSYAEFSRRAAPVLAWSRTQVPECRHFVKIDDRVDGGKEAFKHGLLTIENFFYKLLLN